jgi:hypothetical protein
MTDRTVVEAELRALAGEMVSTLRIISESAGPLRKSRVRSLLLEAERALKAACELADRLR